MRCLLILYGLFAASFGLKLFARTDRSLSMLDIDVVDRVATSNVIVADVNEDLSISLAVDVHKNIGFYTLRNQVYAVDLTNGTQKNLGKIGFGLEEQPTSIAYEWVTDKLYLSLPGFGHDNAARVLLCSANDSTHCSVIMHQDLDYMYSITLDPIDGNMYWLNGISRSIEKAFLNGQHHDRHPFDDLSKTGSDEGPTLTSLSLDVTARRLFFVRTRVKSEIWSCELYVRDSCHRIATVDQIVHIVVESEFLVWSNARGQISICKIEKCEDTIVIIENTSSVETFVIVEADMQPKRNATNPCATSNGGCSDFCSLVHFDPWATCSCPIGIRMLSDGKTCEPTGVDKVLLISAVSGLYTLTLDTDDFTPRSIPFEGSEKATHKLYDIDYDPVDKKVYWMDADLGAIRRVDVNGSQTQNVLAVPKTVKVFRLDYANRNIYWIDPTRHHIMISSIETNFTRIIVSGGLTRPQALTLDMKNSHVYYTDADETRNRIERVGFDGLGRKTVMRLAESAWPNGLDYDHSETRLYWTEGNYSVIKTMLSNSNESSVIGPATKKLLQPHSITKLGDTIFCNSLAGRSLMRTVINVTSGEIRSAVVESPIYGPIGIKAISLQSKFDVTSTCQHKNGGCSHICTTDSRGVKACLCGAGFELQDGTNCKKPSAFAVLAPGSEDSDLHRLSLGTLPNLDPIGVWNTSTPPTSMDYDQKSGQLYLAGSTAESGFILRTTLDGSSTTTVLRGPSLKGIHSIALDYVSKNIYWANPLTRQVEVCDASGRFRRAVAWKDIQPTNIVVYPPAGIIIFVDQGTNTTIKRMSLAGAADGGDDILGDLDTVVSMVVDSKREQLYWADTQGTTTRVSVAKLDGSYRETLYVGTDIRPVSLFSFNFKLYYLDSTKSTFGYYDGRKFSTLHENVRHVGSMIIAHGQGSSDTNECAFPNSICPELCLSTNIPHTSPCACRDHYIYDVNAKVCKAPENSILVGAPGKLLSINIRKQDKSWSWNQDPIKELPVPLNGSPVAVAYDLHSGLLFWLSSSDHQGHIHYVLPNKPNEINTVSQRHHCVQYHDISLDDLGRQLYASCSTVDHSFIVVYRIQENSDTPLKYIGVVVSGETISSATGYQAQPRGIAVIPFNNYLFYVDVSPSLHAPAIVQCQLNGRKCQVWFAIDLWPITRLHADPANLRLFYTCPSGVWSRDIGLSSSNVRHHFHSANASDYAVAPIDEDRVLVAELMSDSSRVHEVFSNTIVSLPPDTVSLQRFGPNSPFYSTCRLNECSHLCRVLRDSKQKHECTCPLGFVVNIETNGSRPSTTCVSNVQCLPWEFACDDGRTCIHAAKKCDRVPQCSDGSDESPKVCLNTGYQWPCDDGAGSIERTSLCNGASDCDDGSDEKHCRCDNPAVEFDCGANPLHDSNECIARNRLCDGFNDCENGQDEDPKMCIAFPRPTQPYQASPEWVYIALLVLIVVIIVAFLTFCCCRHHPYCSPQPEYATARYRLHEGAEASILLPPTTGTQQYEVAVRTYSLVDSTSTYPALPPPNSTQTYSSRSRKSQPSDIPQNRFYAPPPSAASLSTYGVVKPAELRLPHNQRPKKRRKPSSPPPSYGQVEQFQMGSLTGLGTHPPQMSSTPKSGRTQRFMTRSHANSGTLSRIDSMAPPNATLLECSSSSSVGGTPPRPLSQSSSSLSSHSSEEGLHSARNL